MAIQFRGTLSVGLVVAMLSSGASLRAATPTAEAALKLTPVQKDVDYDHPAQPGKCSIKAEKSGGKTGWVVRDPGGQIVRIFLDTNGDNVVDQWSYFKDGVEVYRDVDQNFNGKADQYRWLNTAGTRWGVDRDEDGRIDSWKIISAEEVTAEVVAALHDRDLARFQRLVLTPAELKSLGLGAAKTAEITKKIQAAPEAFRELMARQTIVGPETRWVYFGGSRPSLIPAGTADSTADVIVYENVAATVDTAGKPNQLPIGALVKVGDAWKVIDAPRPSADGSSDQDRFFLPNDLAKSDPHEQAGPVPSKKTQELLKELGEIDKSPGATPAEQAKLNARRASILEELASSSENAQDRAQWLRQFADTVGAASQAGVYPGGVERLKGLVESLRKNPDDAELAAYVEFRYMTADYNKRLQETTDYPGVQAQWVKDLEAFIAKSPKSPDSAEAMLQLGIAQEFAGEDAKALTWYDEIVKHFASSTAFTKAKGAKTRLESVGKPMRLSGKNAQGGTIDLSSREYRGKVVLIQYWTTWCEPCKGDLPMLKDVLERYGKKFNFAIIGVSLDNTPKALEEFLEDNKLPWPQIFEPGGLDSRLANEMGVLALPTMILVDKDGKVLNRNVHASDLENELKTVLKPQTANKSSAEGAKTRN